MGVYASNFQVDKGVASTPRLPEWIVEHVDVTGLTIVEVERLWTRFQQIGCREDTGVLEQEVLSAPHISSDVFVRNIMKNFVNKDGVITFETFCNAVQWIEDADMDTKVRASYHLLNNGNLISRQVLSKVLSRLYPEESDVTVARLTDGFLSEMDDKRQGYIDEDQFVRWVRSLPSQQLEMLLEFHIIPEDLKDEDDTTMTLLNRSYRRTPHSQSRRRATETPQETKQESASKQIPTDYILSEIATKACNRDWYLLANKLGFTSSDISEFENLYPQRKDKVFFMLKSWRDREGKNAYSIVLEKALRSSNMNDIAMILQP